MPGTMWDRISAAYRSIAAGEAQKVEIPGGIKVYQASGLTRIDIPSGVDLEVHDPVKRREAERRGEV